jgi:hypothetical protein
LCNFVYLLKSQEKRGNKFILRSKNKINGQNIECGTWEEFVRCIAKLAIGGLSINSQLTFWINLSIWKKGYVGIKMRIDERGHMI